MAVRFVAPCVGAWIEISEVTLNARYNIVAPCVGAWIEILMKMPYQGKNGRRSLRGSVD